MKRLPIGFSDFKTVVEGNYYYVDKTLLIKELLDRGSAVTLLPRPRRFGKTINLSMLYYFFSNTAHASHLFEHTAIAQDAESMAHQGQYPVIFLTFKDIKTTNWPDAYAKIKDVISEYFLKNDQAILPILSDYEQILWSNITHKTGPKNEFENSLKFASEILQRYYQQKVIILLDEYDAPIHAAYHYGYYQEMVAFIRNLLSGAFKDNSSLAFSVMTGILRTAKEGIFSGLNNLKVYTLLHEPFSAYFGFTQAEVDGLLSAYDLQSKSAEIQRWYNGYQFAGTTLYNPWSLLNCAQDKGLLQPYWVNTSDNALIFSILAKANDSLKIQLESLLTGQVLQQEVDEALIFPDMENQTIAIWSLLLFSGYLTAQQQELIEGHWICELVIPNKEITFLYKQLLERSFTSLLSFNDIKKLYHVFETGDGDFFEEILQKYILNSMSMFDLPSTEPEKSYHLFVLGLLVTLSEQYEIRSNRESGFGRYDIMIIPKDNHKRGIIVEFKCVGRKEGLESAAQSALKQIHEKQYATELRQRGIKQITAFGIAFKNKEVLLNQEEL